MNQEFRYPGLASFTTEQRDLFFGRKRETRELFHLLSVEKTVVLFSKSGLGKTSLLNAGVIPLLAGNRIWPVPIRFGDDRFLPEANFRYQFEAARRRFNPTPGPSPDGRGDVDNTAMSSAEDSSPYSTEGIASPLPSGEGPGVGLWEQIKSSPFLRDGEPWTPLLIFDQFEELFTLYPQPERRARFVQELADLIQERLPERLREALFEQLDAGKISPSAIAEAEKAPPLKIVFSIRSDMLHFMDELSEQIPYILRSRYQLFGLGEEQAREAIVAPAALPRGERFATEPFGYTEEALHEIIGTLTKNREVESFQLQAVCQALEEKVLALNPTPGPSPEGRGAAASSVEYAVDSEGVRVLSTSPLPSGEGSGVGLLIAPAFYGGTEGIERILEESYQRRLDSLGDADWKLAAARLLEDALVNENGRRRSVDVADLLARPGVTPELLDALERQRLVRKEPRLDSFYYEISHDTLLAPIVKSRRAREAEEEKARVAAELAEQKRQAEATRRRLLVVRGLLAAAVVALFAAVLLFIRANNSEREAIEQRNQAKEALDKFVEAERLRKETEVKNLQTRAVNYLTLNQKDLAIEALQEALRIDSTNATTRKQLEQLLRE